jgi:hypothetical protein
MNIEGAENNNKDPLEMLRQQICQKWGNQVRYPRDCEALSEHIFHLTRQQVHSHTLQRFFKLLKPASERPRDFTLDTLARYIGYADFNAFVENKPLDEPLVSGFEYQTLGSDYKGDIFEIAYAPNRRLKLKLREAGLYEVLESENSKLMKGDLLEIEAMVLRFPLYVRNVIRDKKELGPYIGAKSGGLTRLVNIKE